MTRGHATLMTFVLMLGCAPDDPPLPEPRVLDVAAGYSTACALTDGGEVYCWGAADRGALGLGDRGVGAGCEPGLVGLCDMSTCCVGDDEAPGEYGPVDLGGPALSIATGNLHTCAVLEDGVVRCWGTNNFGVLGLGRNMPAVVGKDESPREVAVALGVDATAVVSGSAHACALTVDGGVRCWGQGNGGVLGYASSEDVGDDETPAELGDVRVGGVVEELFAGYERTCVILADGTARCWGVNDVLQTGLADDFLYGDDEHPEETPALDFGTNVVDLALGQQHSCALTDDGDVRCWGVVRWAGTGDMGFESRTSADAQIVELGRAAVAIDAGTEHTCAVLDDGSARCWGASPEVGYASTDFIGDDELPADLGPVMVGDELLDVAGGERLSCGVTSAGQVRCWGTGGWGLLGQPDHTGAVGDDEQPASVSPLKLW